MESNITFIKTSLLAGLILKYSTRDNVQTASGNISIDGISYKIRLELLLNFKIKNSEPQDTVQIKIDSVIKDFLPIQDFNVDSLYGAVKN
jgi:hypothetical protein